KKKTSASKVVKPMSDDKLASFAAIVVPLLSFIGVIGMIVGVNDDIDRCKSSNNSLQIWVRFFVEFITEEWTSANCTNYPLSAFSDCPVLEEYTYNMGASANGHFRVDIPTEVYACVWFVAVLLSIP
ncbi:935_t:CDS:2, partial [Dentiscutata erythropus]